ncbi:MAG TPA: GNAT family N-acetyltransferase [Pseudolabrys sp.]|jgi:diamine N-acetyltransferase|nr:GNAT family N-acetyltransferase [Pseudolabrys sp.]
MTRTVKLTPVTRRNWEAVADLELAPEQRELVAGNLYSLAESKFDPSARPRAIVAGGQVVGFLMYDVSRGGRRALIYRFMIDRRQQGKGYGRAALAAAIAEIGRIRGMKTVAISYMAGNRVARDFYAGFGFRPAGRDADGEVIAELKL